MVAWWISSLETLDKFKGLLWAEQSALIREYREKKTARKKRDAPLHGFDRNLLINQFSSLLKDKVASFGLGPVGSSKCLDQGTLPV